MGSAIRKLSQALLKNDKERSIKRLKDLSTEKN